MARLWLRGTLGFLVTGAAAAALLTGQARSVPAPAEDTAVRPAASDVALFAGGCFWGVQGVFQHVTGVTSAVSGFAGSTSAAGPVESVQITFDPRQVSYGQLLHVFFAVVHDPTQVNRQGPDVGPEYRSAVFPANADQARVAAAYIRQLTAARVFPAPIATSVEQEPAFRAAGPFHQDYLVRHPSDPYIVVNDLPKVDGLRRLFPALYRATPRLVLSGR